jgi:hypothetical protein
MPDSAGSYLPAQEGSGAATYPTALYPTSLLGRALTLPRIPWLWIQPPCSGQALGLPCVSRLWILPPCSGGLQCCHVSHGTGPRFPTWEGSDAATCSTALCGPHTLRIKKCLADLPMWLGSRDFKACPHVIETPDT